MGEVYKGALCSIFTTSVNLKLFYILSYLEKKSGSTRVKERLNYLLPLSVQFGCSVVSNCLQLHGLQHTRLPCPSPISWSLLKLMSIKSVMPSNHHILCRPLLLLPSIFLQKIL